MKLKRLELKAFGPFTDRTLEFNSERPGLHIIYGPNEAGKSSSLRALKALLCGFPKSTPDNFIHNYNKLLVGGCFENNRGEELFFRRRKRRIQDIIDENGDPVDHKVFSEFIPDFEPDLFESLYGIDHDNLIRGGEDILARKGDVGQALFSAGAGMASLGKVIDQLEKEAADLFKPAGQNPEINRAVKEFNELKKKARESSLSYNEWKKHHTILISAEKKRTDLEQKRRLNDKELRRLYRLQQAIPELAALKNLQKQLNDLGRVIPLPSDFAERYKKVTEEIRVVKQQLDKSCELKKNAEEKRSAISVNKELLNNAVMVDDFHQRLGEYRKGQKDRPVREGMRISLRREAGNLLLQVRSDLSLDDVEVLRPMLGKKKTVQTLSTKYEAITQKLAMAEKQSSTAEAELKDTAAKLDEMPVIMDSSSLSQAVKLARKAGDIDALLEKNINDAEIEKKACLSQLMRIGLWSGDLAQLMELPLPSHETVEQFENHYSKIADEIRELQKDSKKNKKDLKKALAEIKKAEYAGSVPSEKDLIHTREKRETGWQLLRQQWIENKDVTEESKNYDPLLLLPDAYETYVKKADTIADRLRWEADRVANVAGLNIQVKTLEESLAENEKDKKALDLKKKELDAKWLRVWQPVKIIPRTPKEMNGFLTRMEKLRFKVENIFKKEQETKLYVQKRKDLKKAVEKGLDSMVKNDIPAGEKLGPVLIFAETVLEKNAAMKIKLEKLKDRQNKAEKTFNQAGKDLKTAREALERWQDKWRKALSGLRLKQDVTTSEAIDLIDTLKDCFDKLKEADDLRKRIAGIDRDASKMDSQLKDLLKKVAPDLLDLPMDRAILELRVQLGKAQKDKILFDKLTEESDLLKKEIYTAQKKLQSAHEQMNELLRMAKCDRTEELTPVMEKFAVYQGLQEKISETSTRLTKIGAGVPPEELEKQAAKIDVDELPGMTASIKNDIEENINPEINRISQVIGEEKNILAAMDGGDRAALLTCEMEEKLAGIQRLAKRYAHVKLASKILQQEIERYREANQDPVLKIASKYFKDLTLDSFTGLRTDVDDKGDPVLVGIRTDNTFLNVESMSSGTRDQLYLALRLATLDWRLEKRDAMETSEAMPFIVDDILINFDDDRSRATLKVMSELSEKNQIILFTHHRQILEEAEKIKGKGTIEIHRL